MGRPRKKPEAEFYVAKEGFVTQFKGDTVSVSPADPIPAGHPILKGREDLFKPWVPRFALDETEADPPLEQATASPGDKRP